MIRAARATMLVGALVMWPFQVPATHVYLIGDSTMADKPTPETNPERGWGQLLPRFLTNTSSCAITP